MKRILCSLLLMVLLLGCHSNPVVNQSITPSIKETKKEINMHLIIGEELFIVELEDNQTVQELIKRLPFTITMHDFQGVEKAYYFNEVLPNNAQKVNFVESGDIMLFGNDCLVIFYESFPTSYSYTKIGHITNSDQLKTTLGDSEIEVRWELSSFE